MLHTLWSHDAATHTVTSLPTPMQERPILLPSTHVTINYRIPKPKIHLAAAVGCSICTTQPSFVALAFTVHRYLIYPFLQNLIKCLWISESKNLCLWTCGVCVHTDERWTDVSDSMIVNLKIYSACGVLFFFSFLAFWLFGFVTLCDSVFMTLSLVLYRKERERERERESRVCKD